MASYHVLTGSKDGNSFRVAYHIPISSSNNAAGINYRTALINSGLGGTTILKDGDGTGGSISAAEKAEITSGATYEHLEDIATNPGESAAALKAKIDARHPQLVTLVQNYLAKALTYFGYTVTLP